MQLNNKITGESYILNRVNTTNAVFYNKEDVNKAITVQLTDLESTILKQAQLELGADYEVSTNDYNWVHSLSSEGVATTVRLTVPSSIVNADPNSDVSNLILSLSNAYVDVTTKTQFTSTTYLTTISSQYVSVLEPSVLNGDIIVERLEAGEVIQLLNLNDYKI